MRFPLQTSALFAEFQSQGVLVAMVGPDVPITGIAARESCGPGDLVFVDQTGDLAETIARGPAAVVVSGAGARECSAAHAKPAFAILTAAHPGLAHALIRQKYHARDPRENDYGNRHPAAVVHATADVAPDVVIGPRAVIGARVRIGAGSAVLAGAVIEDGAELGAGCVIHPNAVIGYDCRLGDRVIVKAGAVIGSEGYGFAQDERGRSYRVPQTGRVVIEDDVEIGANNCIDRATYDETRVGRGTKLDNLCHIAHNVRVGEDCLLTAGLVVAGSTRIGNRVIASGQTGILDHLKIADGVVLLHRAAVLEDIDEPGMYAGNPAMPLQPYMKNMAIFRNLNDLRKKVAHLEKDLKAVE